MPRCPGFVSSKNALTIVCQTRKYFKNQLPASDAIILIDIPFEFCILLLLEALSLYSSTALQGSPRKIIIGQTRDRRQAFSQKSSLLTSKIPAILLIQASQLDFNQVCSLYLANQPNQLLSIPCGRPTPSTTVL